MRVNAGMGTQRYSTGLAEVCAAHYYRRRFNGAFLRPARPTTFSEGEAKR